ncbi:MAG: hypothetical protein U9N30_02725 [Campylobacterota bacterium]|nr:hypothetical protein [Campylobacterota bacterium]
MNIITFDDNIDDGIIDAKHEVSHCQSGYTPKSADVAILDINTIFDFEEKKHDTCKEKFVSIAIIDDESDYDAFKNFGIDAWIKREDIDQLNGIINLVDKKLLS